ncbi:J domain-containing protein [Rhodotorula paludigena]|uniref:J domain-containing protein n=1 Tax=Rhodotorula paludigena TaxID=86838 RepID=UPI00317336EF
MATASFGDRFGRSSLEQGADDAEWEQSDPLFRSTDAGDEPRDLLDSGHDGLYAVLNLERTCSDDDVQRAYRRLAALLHPDRHRDPALKPAADARFQHVSHAYEILSDPHKRAIYDELGEAGLKTNWEVATKGKTAAELRAEYERLNRQQVEQNVENLVKSKGEVTVISDARVLFLSDADLERLGGPEKLGLVERLRTVQQRQMFLKHSFTTPINPSTALIATTQVVARQGSGAGNLLLKLQHNPSSRLSLELGTTLLRPRSLTFKTTYAPDNDTFARLDFPVKTLAAPPKFNLVLGRRIYERTTGTLTFRSGAWALGTWGAALLQPYSDSTVSIGLNHASGWAVEATSAVFAKQVSVNYGRTVLGGFKVSIGGVVTNVGAASLGINADRRVTENCRAGMGLDIAANGSMTVKLRFSRLGQKLNLPIIVSSGLDLRLAAGFTLVPALGIIATNHFVLAPRKRQKLTSKLRELRKEHAEWIREKRQEALDAQALLAEHVQRRIRDEEAKNGLVIEKAVYGVLDAADAKDQPDDAAELRWLDVTVPLQALLAPSASQLTIPSGRSKATLLGFCDSAIGEKKRLRVRYRFRGKVHEAVWDDRDAVALPMRSHLVEEGAGDR